MQNQNTGSKTTISLKSTLLVTVSSFFLFESNALAQDSAASFMTEEILVTARKREESILDIPLAVTAFTGAQLQNMGVRNLTEIAEFTPGLILEEQNTARNDRAVVVLTFRAVNPGNSTAISQTGNAFVDGAPVAGAVIAGLTDIERIEIIKGPQSAQFGRATFAGAVNYITRTPGDSWRGQINAEAARFGTVDVSASVEGPILEDLLSFRASGRLYDTDGQYTNSLDSGERLGARQTQSGSLTLYATPSDNFSAKLYLNYWEDNDGAAAQVVFGASDPAMGNCPAGVTVAPWICGNVPSPQPGQIAQETVATPDIQEQVLNNGAGYNLVFNYPIVSGYGFAREAWQSNLNMDYSFNNGMTLTSITAVRGDNRQSLSDQDSRDSSGVPNGLAAFIPGATETVQWSFLIEQRTRDFSQELRLDSKNDERFTWSIGLNYYDFEGRGSVNSAGPFGFLQFGDISINQSETIGVFGSASYEITDTLTLSAEARQQWDTVSEQIGLDGDLFEETFDSFTPRIILNYQPRKNISLYATYAKGVRAGAINADLSTLSATELEQVLNQTGAGFSVPEETIGNYEVGFKGAFFDRRLTIATAVYFMNWNNQHQSALANVVGEDDPTDINLFGVTTAVGETDLWGIELEGGFQVTDSLLLQGSFNISDSDIKVFNCAVCVSITGSEDDALGNRVPRTAKYTGTLSATYTGTITSSVGWFTRADYIYTGNKFATFTNLARTGEVHRVNLRAGIRTEAIRLEAFVTNLLDNDAYAAVQSELDLLDLSFASQAVVGALPNRRSWGMRASYQF